MLKSILSFFCVVGRATPDQSKETLDRLNKALKKRLKDSAEGYTAVFGYGMRAGVMSTQISCYAVGFSRHDSSLAIVPIYYDSDEIEDLCLFNPGEIESITVGLQGEKIIKSKFIEGGQIRITVPHFTNENAEDMYQLPIQQMEAVDNFEKWIKEKF